MCSLNREWYSEEVLRKLHLALFLAPLFAQDASPDVDAALRARVDRFYQAHVSGKFREAIPVVADESQDWFIGSGKESYKSCQTTKIEYSENSTKALVTETCQGEYRVHGHRMPVSLPIPSHWKIVDGQWFWYYIRETEVRTPFGIARITPDNDPDAAAHDTSKPIIPANPLMLARDILQSIKIDKTEIRLEAGKANEDAIEVTNGMSGSISISVDNPGQAGLTVKPDKTELKARETARVVFRYNPEDPLLQCGDCAKHVNGTVTAQLRVQPTGQVFPINIIITRREPPVGK